MGPAAVEDDDRVRAELERLVEKRHCFLEARVPVRLPSLLGERHRFVIDDENPDGWLLAYCPKDTDKPSIKGTITIARDTTFAAVDWLFQTPEPVEHAGGRAFFRPILSRAVLSHLLPAEAVVWREIPAGGYLQSYQRYEDWRVAPGDSVPLLPLRRERVGADVSR